MSLLFKTSTQRHPTSSYLNWRKDGRIELLAFRLQLLSKQCTYPRCDNLPVYLNKLRTCASAKPCGYGKIISLNFEVTDTITKVRLNIPPIARRYLLQFLNCLDVINYCFREACNCCPSCVIDTILV